MRTTLAPRIVLCNGAIMPQELMNITDRPLLELEYRDGQQIRPNVRISLPDFVRNVYHLPDRVLDLLEIAAYVYSADRLTSRGSVDDLEYHSWARAFHFAIKVRDYDFWHQRDVAERLSDLLCFVTGDQEYTFTFQPGHKTPPTSLFDRAEFKLDPTTDTRVVLFSGGIDSLAGAIEQLETSSAQVCLVTHRVDRPNAHRAQVALVSDLDRLYPNRLTAYKFGCSLREMRGAEESQRTRAFLYGSIAYALGYALSKKRFFVHENGVTSLNFPRRRSAGNARTSRTTHPKTLASMAALFTMVDGADVEIESPFLWKTKTDVFSILTRYGRQDLIAGAVSCSRTFPTSTEPPAGDRDPSKATQCGGCYQCIDRRFASYAAETNDAEHDLYALDFVVDAVRDGTVATGLMDYVRQARDFATWTGDRFYEKTLNQLVEVVEHLGCEDEAQAVERVWQLCHRHGEQVLKAIRRMQTLHDHPYYAIAPGSLLARISQREHLKEPIERLVDGVCRRLCQAIPLLFQHNVPKDEPDFNDKVSGVIQTDRDRFEREHPAIKFGIARVIPDHSWGDFDLLIESKYIRKATTPSKASEGIAADLTKYPTNSHKLFVVYDPSRCIVPDSDFKESFERKGNCTVCVVR